MQFLQPLLLRNGYWQDIEEKIRLSLYDLIFKPLLSVLKSPHPEYQNSLDPLADAIVDGSVWYDEGHFYGEFSGAITRELKKLGALYHTKSRTWSLESSLVPPALRMAQAHANLRYDALRRGFVNTLADINVDSIDQFLKTQDIYHRTIDWMNDDFKKSVRAITIPPDLTDSQKKIIREEWGQNLKLYIKDWASQAIVELREKVQAEAFQGRRAESLHAMLQDQYGVSKRKAEFLARQETSLLMSKFRETRYAEIGIQRYKWSTSHDERVRKDHDHLNGKIFSFSEPPVTNRKTGARNNPGEDFGCRCVAIPVVD